MNSRTKTIIWGIVLIIVIVASYIGYGILSNKHDAGQPQKNYSGSNSDSDKVKAIDFNVTDSEGNSVLLSSHFGKPIVLNFWASWCGPCRNEMPDFQEVYDEIGDEIIFMMINLTDGNRETQDKAESFIAEFGFTFPVYFDKGMEAANNYRVYSIPTTYFIDEDGYISSTVNGMLNKKILKERIEMITSSKSKDKIEYSKIAPSDAKRIMDEGENHIVLDVRTEQEYIEEHIKDAVLLPNESIMDRAESELTDKNQLILVYCRSGVRSADAAKKLIQLGYTNVHDFGGIIDWPYEKTN